MVEHSNLFRIATEECVLGLRRPRGLRAVSALEQEETFKLSGVLDAVGLTLLVLGAAVDPQTQDI